MKKFHGLNRSAFPIDSTYHSFGTLVFKDQATRGFCLAIVRSPPSKSTSVAGITLGTTTVRRPFRKIPTLMPFYFAFSNATTTPEAARSEVSGEAPKTMIHQISCSNSSNHEITEFLRRRVINFVPPKVFEHYPEGLRPYASKTCDNPHHPASPSLDYRFSR